MTEKATFAGGCFWCTEAIFNSLKGVDQVVVGVIDPKIEKLKKDFKECLK